MSYRFADSLMSANLYDIYQRCVYSEKLLMMDRGTVRNMQFYSINKFKKLVHLVGFIIRTCIKFGINICVTFSTTVKNV